MTFMPTLLVQTRARRPAIEDPDGDLQRHPLVARPLDLDGVVTSQADERLDDLRARRSRVTRGRANPRRQGPQGQCLSALDGSCRHLGVLSKGRGQTSPGPGQAGSLISVAHIIRHRGGSCTCREPRRVRDRRPPGPIGSCGPYQENHHQRSAVRQRRHVTMPPLTSSSQPPPLGPCERHTRSCAGGKKVESIIAESGFAICVYLCSSVANFCSSGQSRQHLTHKLCGAAFWVGTGSVAIARVQDRSARVSLLPGLADRCGSFLLLPGRAGDAKLSPARRIGR